MIAHGGVMLCARAEDDIAVLHDALYNDVAAWVRADHRPWRPLPVLWRNAVGAKIDFSQMEVGREARRILCPSAVPARSG